MRGNAQVFRVLWVALCSVLWVVGCGGDAFDAAPSQPSPDAAGDVDLPDSPGPDAPNVDGADANHADGEPDASDGGQDDALPDVSEDAQDASDATTEADGDAPAPPLTLSPDPLDFGDQRVGVVSAPMGLTIENTGSGQLPKPALTFLGAHPGDFALVSDNCPAGGLAPSASCVAELSFTPSERGTREATVVVLAGSEVTLGAVRGNGLDAAALDVDPTEADFATVVVPNTSSPVAVKVTNTGGSNTPDLTTVIEPAGAPFAITSNTCVGTQLSPGAECFVSVTFHPTSAGSVSGALRVAGAGLPAVTTSLTGTGATPGQLSMSPTSGDLGQVTVDEIGPVAYFNVTNGDTVATGTLAVELEGTNADDFAIASNGCTGALQGNQSCVVGVRLAPKAPGSKIATLKATASPGGAATASLSGTGLRKAQLVMIPTTQDFGTVGTGQTSGPFSFTVQNSGGSPSGTITVSKVGTDASQFTVDQATTCGAALAPGASCVVVVRFAPTSGGQKEASIHATAAPGGDVSSTLMGFSGTPALGMSPTTWDFGSLAIGTPSTVEQFTVTNSGTVQSGVPNVALAQVPPADFDIVSNTCTVALAPSATCTIEVKFTPTTAGTQAATLQVSADPGGSAVASLQGRGLTPAQLTLTPGSANFGTVPLNQSSSPVAFTLTNTGETSTTAVTIGVTGTDAGDFSFQSTCPPNQPLAGGVSCTITVTFTPQAQSVRQATLAASATSGGSVSSSLTGTGTSLAALTITPVSHDYGSVAVDGSSSYTYTVKNTGGSTSGTIQMQLGDTTNFSLPSGSDGCSGNTLAASATCNVVVAFTPKSAGTKETALSAQANPGGTATASLSGYGLGPALLHLSPNSFTFPNIPVGQASAPVLFTLSNDGASPSGALTFAITGTDETSYQVATWSGNDGCTAGSTLPAGATCKLAVVFSPISFGVKQASLTASASPGGSPTATLVGGTPDIFVSMEGNDNEDGRTMATAVRHITNGLSMATVGWTVHVAASATAYGDGEGWPLTVTDGVRLRGEVTTDPLPVIEPPASASVTSVVELVGTGSWVELLEIRSGTGLPVDQTNRSVVWLKGSSAKLERSVVNCQVVGCVAVQVTSAGTSKVISTTATIKGNGPALRSAPTSGGQVQAELFTAQCPETTNVTNVDSYGVDSSTGRLLLLASKVTHCVHGVLLSSNGYLQMRDTEVSDSYRYGVEINLGKGTATPMPDLGTANSPGNNTITSHTITSSVGLAVKSASTSVDAVGNTWLSHVQGSDAAGHYAPGYHPGPVQEPTLGSANYSISSSTSGIQF